MNRRQAIQQVGTGLAALSVSNEGIAQHATQPKKRVMRLAHLTDIHMMPLVGAAKGFEACLHHVQNLPDKPDLIINGGDSIMEAHGWGQTSVRRQWKLYQDVLKSENQIPVLSCIGNHDIFCRQETHMAFLDGRQWALDELQMTHRYYSISQQGWHIIMLDSIQTKADGSWFSAQIDDEQWHWLKADLKETPAEMPILLISHVPILAACVFFDGSRLTNDTWTVPTQMMHSDTRRLVNLFAHYPNVKAALSGHIHLVDRVEYRNIKYYCNGAVCGAWWFGEYHHTPPGYSLIDLYEDGSVENSYLTYC